MLDGIVMGLVQGLTEFLPVSSSGHLAIFGSLLGLQGEDIFLEVLVHVATLLAVLVVFRHEVLRIYLSPLRIPGILRREGWAGLRRDAALRVFFLIMLASLPAAAAGILLKTQMAALFNNLYLVAGCLFLTGLLLLASRRVSERPQGGVPDASGAKMRLRDALAIGTAQAFAILPGLSRSGSTITAGLFCGVDRNWAGVFSFLLAIPVISGAALLDVFKALRGEPLPFLPALHIPAFITAFVVGLVALTLLMRVIRRGRLFWFAWYCFAAAAAGLLYAVLRA
jgi:undecaprenyl-diphosphatase